MSLICVISLFYIGLTLVQFNTANSSFASNEYSLKNHLTKFSLEKSNLQILSPQTIFSLIETYNSSSIKHSNKPDCELPDYQFTPEELHQFWKYKDFKPCAIESNDLISITDNIVSAQCQNGEPAQIALDSEDPQKLGSIYAKVAFEYKESKDLGKKEFVFVKCSESAKYARVINRFDDDISRTAQSKRYAKSKESKPLAVLLLVFDSISRQSAHLYLNKTLDFLQNELSNSYDNTFSAYEFDKSSVSGLETVDNLVPILFGKTKKEQEKILDYLKKRRRDKTDKTPLDIKRQESSIWKYFSSLNVIPFFSFKFKQCLTEF